MRRTLSRTVFAAILLLGLLPAGASSATDSGEHSDNLELVKNLPYAARNGKTPNYGTDLEFVELEVGKETRSFALAGSYRNGLQIVDITDPEEAEIVAVYDCGVTQGDVQVFRRDDAPGRTFVGYTSDTFGDGTSTCYREAKGLGFTVHKTNGSGKNGTFIADITDPYNPTTVSFVEVPKGSHNHTIHPSGKFLYNSNSDLITSVTTQAIEVYDISDFAAPEQVATLPLPARPGLGTESHDLTFNRKGTRAYSAALSQGVIIDTTDPAKPAIVSSWIDPAINVWHQADPFTLTDRATKQSRDFVIVEDEFAGAVGTGQCPNGGFHVYDVTGANEKSPVKVGAWNIDTVGATASPTNSCTAHVFDIHEKEAIMTVAFYNGGVRVVDLSDLVGYSLGSTSLVGGGMKEIAFYRTPNANSWSAKTPHIQGNGNFYLYGNDINRGLDIYKFTAAAKPSKNHGRWQTPAESRASATPRTTPLTAETAPFCLLPTI